MLKPEMVERMLEQVSDERNHVRGAFEGTGRGCASDDITAALFHLPSTAVLTASARPFSETASLVLSIFTQSQSTLRPQPDYNIKLQRSTQASAASITILIFDATVMAITAYFAWTSSKQLQNIFGTRQSLTVIFLQQGVVRFYVSVILICRFILQLRRFNTRVQTVPSVHIASTPGIRGRLQHIHKTLIEEFGNSGIEYGLETENDMTELEGDTAPSAGIDTEAHIMAEEFPWIINPV
ncbi:hypothetical protein M422DRAFT_268554 [Sphaerobolus stellatus SS14]|uniref:Uncharacterized protein n=1 Tax=Sphaerobolus stellatus (strain SS14) TaxID=990650 RepID=A0A0C9U6U3_SPHS4|nr:hypothetical protein M422DRAFT_268554 [Sphaerobolus stellatus SS14]